MFWMPCPLRVIAFVGMFMNAWYMATAASTPTSESGTGTWHGTASARDRRHKDRANASGHTDASAAIESEVLRHSSAVEPDATECDRAQAKSKATIADVHTEPNVEAGETEQAASVEGQEALTAAKENPAYEEATGESDHPVQGEDFTEGTSGATPEDPVDAGAPTPEDTDASDGEQALREEGQKATEPEPTEPKDLSQENGAEDDGRERPATCWVTKSGHSYHTDQACRAVRKSALHEIPLQEAQEKGYEPCGICAI